MTTVLYTPHFWCAKQADGIIIYKGDVKLQPCTKMDAGASVYRQELL